MRFVLKTCNVVCTTVAPGSGEIAPRLLSFLCLVETVFDRKNVDGWCGRFLAFFTCRGSPSFVSVSLIFPLLRQRIFSGRGG